MSTTNDISKLSKKQFLYCRNCKHDTNHICKAEHHSYLPFEHYWEDSWYRIWICAGCETPLFEVESTMMGMENEHGEQVYEAEYFPPKKEDYITPKKFLKLSTKLDEIYKETINAYNQQMHLLCTAGLRSLLEGICTDKGISGSSIKEKINGLKQFLPKDIIENLHEFRFLGNKAIHELDYPDKYNLRLAIDIMDDLINFFYELDEKTKKLANKY